MRNKKETSLIVKRCKELNLDYPEFKQNFYDAINNDKDCVIDAPEESTIYRWYTGETKHPYKKYFKYLANVLEVTEYDLNAGKIIDRELQKELNDLKDQLEKMMHESKPMTNILFMPNHYISYISNWCFAAALLFGNQTYWKIPILDLIAFFSLVFLIIQGVRATKNDISFKNSISLKSQIYSYIEFIKLLFKKTLLSKLLVLYSSIAILIIFLPVLESVCYESSFKISTIVLTITGVYLKIQSLK